jgi:hypothetical protein
VTTKTAQRFRAASAMLVGLGQELAPTCSELLGGLGYRVVFVAHVPAACERIPVVMPLLLVGDADAPARDREDLRERAVAVGAQMLWFPRQADMKFVASALRLAAITALERYGPTA